MCVKWEGSIVDGVIKTNITGKAGMCWIVNSIDFRQILLWVDKTFWCILCMGGGLPGPNLDCQNVAGLGLLLWYVYVVSVSQVGEGGWHLLGRSSLPFGTFQLHTSRSLPRHSEQPLKLSPNLSIVCVFSLFPKLLCPHWSAVIRAPQNISLLGFRSRSPAITDPIVLLQWFIIIIINTTLCLPTADENALGVGMSSVRVFHSMTVFTKNEPLYWSVLVVGTLKQPLLLFTCLFRTIPVVRPTVFYFITF